MYLTQDGANAWKSRLEDALHHGPCFTAQQMQFLGEIREKLLKEGEALPLTSKQLAQMEYLTHHADLHPEAVDP